MVWSLRSGEVASPPGLEVVYFALLETGLLFQPGAFFCKAFLDDVLDRGADLDEIRMNCRLWFKRLCAHSVRYTYSRLSWRF